MSETVTPQMNTVLTLLRRLPLRARLRVIAQVLPEVERDLEAATPSAPPVELDADAQAIAEAQFKQTLVDMGLLAEIKDPMLYPMQTNRMPPVTVEGQPLSEMIIAERR
jgi:hypothetical protein